MHTGNKPGGKITNTNNCRLRNEKKLNAQRQWIKLKKKPYFLPIWNIFRVRYANMERVAKVD